MVTYSKPIPTGEGHGLPAELDVALYAGVSAGYQSRTSKLLRKTKKKKL